MPDRGRAKGRRRRGLAALACAVGLLAALPASAAAAKVIDVPATAVFRAGNNGPNNCTAYVFVQWPEQENAQGWRLEREYLKGTGDIFTHTEVTLLPPFSDGPTGIWEWVPPAGHHWYQHTFRSKSDASGDPVECASLQAEMLGRVLSATVHITVPDTSEEEEAEKEKEEEEKRKEEEKTPSGPPDTTEDPPGKKGKATCRGKTPTIFARPGSATNGTARRDVIMGTPKRDVIRARGGNDLICGLGGNDLILGGAGRDVLLGHGGNDTLRGQGAEDLLLGGNGADRLFGQDAADRLFGQAGADLLNGGPGRPHLCNGGAGRDKRPSPGCERRKLIP